MIEWALMLSLGACVAVGLGLLRRSRTSVASHWVLGWVAASAAGLLMLLQDHLPHARYLSYPLATLFPALLLAGTLAYAGRAVPVWLLPAALGFGSLRAALIAAGQRPLGYALALLVEMPTVLLCAGIAGRVARAGPRSAAERLLAPAFVVLAAAGAAHLAWLARGEEVPWGLVALWLVATPPILGLQLQAAAELERRALELARDRLEERVKERAGELAELNASLRQEVAERQAVEAELRRSEERYRTLAELSADFNFAFRVDPQMRLSLEWMSEHSGLSGLPPGEAARRGWLEVLHPDDRARLQEDFEAARAGRLRETEYRILREDGGVRWVQLQLATIRTDADGSIRVAGVARDVTQRKQAELALRESEERYRIVSELSSDFSFAFSIDRELRLTREWITGAFTRITGYPPEQLEGRGWLELLEAEDRERAVTLVGAGRGLDNASRLHRIRTRDGELRWLEVRIDALHSHEDGMLRVVGAGRDVTEAKRIDAERRRLERHVQEAQRLESLGILAGGIAHDFNNLLTVVLGNARLALEDLGPGSPARARLERVRAAAEDAGRLTEQMLQYSGEASLQLSACDLSKEVEETLGWLRSGLPAGCRLETDLARALPPLDADASQLRQLVRHLVTNAVEALGSAEGTVSVRTWRLHATPHDLADGHGRPDPPSGEYLCLEVEDRGRGMDEATRTRVFEPFFTTKFPGRGLGLAAVLGIARAHRGVVRIASGVGEGTSVRVLLPCTPPGRRVAEPTPGRSLNARVLVVDDEPWVLELTREFLERAGFEVVTAVGGRAGLECLRERTGEIALVVLDLVMPDLGGEQVLEAMRRLAPETPVLVATGLAGETAAQARALAGAAGLVRKPFEPEALVARIRALLG